MSTRSRYQVELLVMSTGERLPMVIRPDGVPDHQALVYAMTVLRPRSGSHHTISQELQGVAALKNFAVTAGIDLRQRVADGTFLCLHEQTAYATFVAGDPPNGPGTRAIRLRSGLRHMLWLARRQSSLLRQNPEARASLRQGAAEFAEELRQVVPRTGSSDREGLNQAQLRGLVALISHPSPLAALWPDAFVCQRNLALVWCLLLLGHRVSEFLGLRISDLSFEDLVYRIQRRPDNPSDPRAQNPCVKGVSRDLTLPPELVKTLRQLVRSRTALPFAAQHDILFTCREGHPLSRGSVTKMFAGLRAKHTFLGSSFCAHVLRHTWNDAFSRHADEKGLSDEQEIKARMLAMGWISRGTAATYTRRHDRKVADAICLEMQREYMAMAA